MKKHVVRKSVLAVALGAVMFSSHGFAESFGDYDQNFRATLPKVQGALAKATEGAKPTEGAASLDEAQKRLGEITAALEEKGLVNESRKELLAEEAKLRKVIDDTQKLKGIKPLLDAQIAQRAKDRTLQLEDAEALAQSLDTSSGFINPQTYSTNDISKVCRNKADFTQLLGMVQSMGTAEMDFLKQGAGIEINKAKDKAIALDKQKVAEFIAHRRELLASNDKADGAKLQPEEFAKFKSVDDIAQRLENIKKVRGPKWDADKKKAEESALGDFESFADNLFKLEENDNARNALVAKFERSIRDRQQQMMQVASRPATALFENCEKVRKAIFTDIDNTGAFMASTYGANAASQEAFLKESVASQNGISRTGQCQDRSTDLAAVIGGFNNNQLETALQDMKAQQSIEGVFASSVLVMDAIRNMQQTQLDPLINDMKTECDDAARTLEQIKNRSNQVVAAVSGGSAGGAGRSAFQGTAARSPIGANPTHNQLVGR